MKADIDNGYLKLANQVVDKLCKTDLSPREARVLNAVVRLTFGYNLPVKVISNVEIIELTELEKGAVSKTKKSLIDRNILVISEKKELGINTKLDDWLGSKSCSTRQLNFAPKVVQADNQKLSKPTTSEQDKSCPSRQPEVVQADNQKLSKPTTSLNKEVKTTLKTTLKTSNRADSKKSVRQKVEAIELPESIPKKSWLEFVQHRIEIKKPMSELAAKKMINQIEKIAARGYRPQDLIDNAIARGWQGVFEPNGGSYAKQSTTHQGFNQPSASQGSAAAGILEFCQSPESGFPQSGENNFDPGAGRVFDGVCEEVSKSE